MREIKISKNDSGQRLDRFLIKCFPALTMGNICKLARKNCIKLNGKKCDTKTHLAENDIIKLFIKDELLEPKQIDEDFTSVSDELDIVYEDENILLINKPQGMVVHEDETNDTDTLINRIKSYLYNKGEYLPEKENTFVPALCNRIDRNTCGIVIIAKNAEALRILNEKIKARELTKKYLCLVRGEMPKTRDLLTGYLKKDSSKNMVEIVDRPREGYLKILTEYTVLAQKGDFSLLEVNLLTGRTHQIRAHLAHIGHPIVGDGKYGVNREDKKLGYKFQTLCSYSLTFSFKDDGGVLSEIKGKTFALKDIWFKNDFDSGKLNGR